MLLNYADSQPTTQAPPPTQSGEAFVGTAAAFAALALVSWDHNQVGQFWQPSIASLCSAEPLPWSRCLSTGVTTAGCRFSSSNRPQCQHCDNHWVLAQPPAQLPLAIRVTNFASGRRAFRSSLLDRCTVVCLIRAISCSSVSTATSECTSAAVCVFCGARYRSAGSVKPPECCRSPSGLKHASCPPSVLGSAAGCACHLRARQHHGTTNGARTYARAVSTHLSLPMLRVYLPTRCLPFAAFQASALRHPHVHCLHRPAQPTWDPTRPTPAAATSAWRESGSRRLLHW